MDGNSAVVKKEQLLKKTSSVASLEGVADAMVPKLKSANSLKDMISLVSISDTIPSRGMLQSKRHGSYSSFSLVLSSTRSFSGAPRSVAYANLRKMLGTVVEVSDSVCIPIERLRFLKAEILGKGSFGEVVRGELQIGGASTQEESTAFTTGLGPSFFSAIFSGSKEDGVTISEEDHIGEDQQQVTGISDFTGCCGVPRRWRSSSYSGIHVPRVFGTGGKVQRHHCEEQLEEKTTEHGSVPPTKMIHAALRKVFAQKTAMDDCGPTWAMESFSQQGIFCTPKKVHGTGVSSRVGVTRPCNSSDDGQALRTVAIKRIEKLRLLRREKFIVSFQTELHFATTLSHPCIVHVYGVAEDDVELHLVMDVAEGGTLERYIKAQEAEVVRDMAPRFLADIVVGLEYLQGVGVAHRDIKPDNMLLTAENHVLLADFGTACYLNDDMGNMFGGTAAYMSPEMVRMGKASITSDLWAVGCVLFEIFVGYPPFSGDNGMFVMRKIKEYKDEPLECPSCLPASAKDLVHRLLRSDPVDRLGSDATGGFKALKAHPFFEGIDWTQLPPAFNSTLSSPRRCCVEAARPIPRRCEGQTSVR